MLLTWSMVKRMIRVRFPDDSPRMLMETFVSMIRPDGIDVVEWTATKALVKKLLLAKAKLDLPNGVFYSYWSQQVTNLE